MCRRSIRTLSPALLLLAVAGLIGCGGPAPRPEPEPAPLSETTALPIADPQTVVTEAQQTGPTLEVAPLENPAVTVLLAQADQLQASGDLESASSVLQRALRIEPDSPRLWQRLAEVRLAQGRLLEAEEMAMRSLRSSGRVGEWCRRNWLTLRETRLALGDPAEAERAAAEAEACLRPPPPRY
jgi:tetratricopeptide (TPR) repeat protein